MTSTPPDIARTDAGSHDRIDPGGEPLVLPTPSSPPRRGGIPVLASVAPVVGAVVIWLVTGNMLALWLAALAPLVALASVIDQRLSARRDRRAADEAAARARRAIAVEVAARHVVERERAWAQHPDVRMLAADESEIWRRSPAREGVVVVGAGDAASRVRVTGGGDDDLVLRARAKRLDGAPVTVPATLGIAVSGHPVLAAAVVRALALQLCLIHAPGSLRVRHGGGPEHAWLRGVPHERPAPLTACVLAPGETDPDGADIVLARVDGSSVPPPGCAVRLDVGAPGAAVVDHAHTCQDIEPELVGDDQAREVVRHLAARAAQASQGEQETDVVLLERILAPSDGASRGPLAATIGSAGGSAVTVDLVADGPHAVVAGMTGSGKSELLVAWVVALCHAYDTTDVVFLLADFKGGTAFDPLASLPHVAGVITDLDDDGARRAIESLRAEIRHRERELARAGARDVGDAAVDLPRLVIVVDEYAALLGEHSDLQAVFTDVAARGRALGMHLILGTQRIAGVVRDALLANCPLRISLRVSDRGDSRAVVGTEDAALLPGGSGGAGLAFVRRAGDIEPQRVRIGLATPELVARTAARDAAGRPRPIWLPPLPAHVDVEDLPVPDEATASSLMLGLADLPHHQTQRALVLEAGDRSLLVVGGAGSGRTTTAETLAAARDAEDVVWLDADDPEAAWDDLERAMSQPPAGGLVVADDIDALLAKLPGDYGAEAAARLERMVRDAGAHGYLAVLTARRLAGPLGRISELVTRRLVLGTASRAEHVALGGDAAHFRRGGPPGRGTLDGVTVQVATSAQRRREHAADADLWRPARGVSGLVGRPSPRTRAMVREWERAGARIVRLDDAPPGGEPSDTATVLVGDPEQWQRQWRTLVRVRTEHDLVIDTACALEYRTLAGDRTLPPYCDPARSRGWLIRRGGAPRRVALPAPSAEG